MLAVIGRQRNATYLVSMAIDQKRLVSWALGVGREKEAAGKSPRDERMELVV